MDYIHTLVGINIPIICSAFIYVTYKGKFQD